MAKAEPMKPIEDSHLLDLDMTLKHEPPTAEEKARVGAAMYRAPEAAAVTAPAAEEDVHVTLHLRHRAEPAEARNLEELLPHEFPCPSYEECEDRYGLHPQDRKTVEEFAKQHHLKVDNVHRAACMIELTGSAANCERAFGVEFERRQDVHETFRGYSGRIQLPESLHDVVDGVTGLDTRNYFHKIAPILPPAADRPEQEGVALRAVSAAAPEDLPPELPAGLQSYFPREVAELYNFPKGLDGTGETIGLVHFGGDYDLEVAEETKKFLEMQGIPMPNITIVGGMANGAPPQKVPPWMYDMEVAANIQTAASVAPGAKFVLYFADRTHPEAYLNAVKMAAFDTVHRPSVISISYGSAEGKVSPQEIRLFNDAARRAGQMGVTICVASGDGGSPTRQYYDFQIPAAHVNFPACSPYVLSCGGTTLESQQGTITREIVWNHLHQCMGASGGGISISKHCSQPRYQAHADLPRNANPGVTFKGRGVPDVAGNAAHLTGYNVLFRGKMYRGAAGTSFVAPLWAGLIARLNQGLGYRCGFINPALYRLADSGAFVNITEGFNGAYSARPGWDPCTGLGRPDGTRLLDAMKDLKGQHSTGAASPYYGTAAQAAFAAAAAAHSAAMAASAAAAAAWSAGDSTNC